MPASVMAYTLEVGDSVPNLGAAFPQDQANTNLVNTPPSPGAIVVPNTAAPTTTRTVSATQSYLSKMPIS